MLNRRLKIVSGGQTGADRAAFDAAIATGLKIGGYIPLDRWSEDGQIPARYAGLIEADSPDPAVRTRLNVEHSDATLIFSHGKLRGGSELTARTARKQGKPLLHIDLDRVAEDSAVERIGLWVRTMQISVLNVAGPRASKNPEIYGIVHHVLIRVFENT